MGCFVVGHLLYVVKVGGDWMSFGRFVLPVVPLLVVLTVVAGMDMVAAAFRSRTILRWLAPIAPLAAGSLVREGFKAPPHTLVAGWPAVVKGDLSPEQRDLVESVWSRYVRYKEAYFADGWPVAVSPAPFKAEPGFADGHPWP